MIVGIIIVTYNIKSEIFLLQIAAIEKYCQDDFVIEVFDNSDIQEIADSIKYHSEILCLPYTKTSSSIGNASESHSWSANLSYSLLRDKYDYFFYLDHDCIPIEEFSVVKILSDKLYAGVAQNAKTYLWPGCFMFNNNQIEKQLIDLSPNHEFKLDTGGNTYKLVERYGKEKGIFFSEEYCQNHHYQKPAYNYYSLINKIFIHFIAASNWANIEDNDARINGLIAIVKEKTQL